MESMVNLDGKITMIKLVLDAIPIYSMFVLKIPRGALYDL